MIKLLKQFLKVRKPSGNILIIGFKFLGDTIFTLPAVQALAENYPGHRFVILCSESNRILYRLKYDNFDYLVVSREEIGLEKSGFPLEFFKLCLRVRRLAPEITVDLTSGIKSSIISMFSGANQSVGFGNPKLRSFFDVFELSDNNRIMTEMFLRPVRNFLGTEIKPMTGRSTGKKVIKNILINPFAGWEAKEWGLRKYIELGTILSERFNVKIVSEKYKIPTDLINEMANLHVTYRTTNTLSELIEEIRKCDLFIGNDSGPLFISNILEKPVFAIFGPTNPKFHMPVIEGDYEYISKLLPCSPAADKKLCFTFGGRKGCPAYECMNQLPIEEVYNSLNNFITKITG